MFSCYQWSCRNREPSHHSQKNLSSVSYGFYWTSLYSFHLFMFNVYWNEIETCVVNLVSYREILRYFHLVLGGGCSASTHGCLNMCSERRGAGQGRCKCVNWTKPTVVCNFGFLDFIKQRIYIWLNINTGDSINLYCQTAWHPINENKWDCHLSSHEKLTHCIHGLYWPKSGKTALVDISL